MTWFKKGEEGRTESKTADEQQQRNFEKSKVRRFSLSPDETAKVVFLDTPDFFLYEHNMWPITGKYDQETCIKDFDTCPLCVSGHNPSLVLVGTVIDTRIVKTEDGKEYKNQKRLIALKGKARQAILRRLSENKNNLQYAVLQFSRGSGTNECATGEDIQVLKKLEAKSVALLCPPDQKPEEFIKPLDYEKLLKPLSVDALSRIAGVAPPVGSESDSTGADIPGDTIDGDVGDVSVDDLIG